MGAAIGPVAVRMRGARVSRRPPGLYASAAIRGHSLLSHSTPNRPKSTPLVCLKDLQVERVSRGRYQALSGSTIV